MDYDLNEADLFAPHVAEDLSSKTPKLHESLRKFEWLVRKWTHASEDVTGDAGDGFVLPTLSISRP